MDKSPISWIKLERLLGHPVLSRPVAHCHDFHEAVLVIAGPYAFAVDNQVRRTVTAGEIVVYPAGLGHHPEIARSPDAVFFIVQWRGGWPGDGPDDGMVQVFRDPLRRCMMLATWLWELGDQDQGLIDALRQALIKALQHGAQGGWQARPATGLEAVLRFMRDNPQHLVTVEYLAQMAGLKRSQFMRRFTAAYGMPPGRMWRQLRLDAIRQSLAAGDDLRTVAKRYHMRDRNYLRRLVRD